MISWSNVEIALDTLNHKNPALFSRSLLIGGWAALLYHRLLALKNDSLFPAPTPDSAARLVSKDLDFTHVWSEDFFDAYPDFVVRPSTGKPYLEVAGIRIGFAQVGVTFDPEEAFEKSRIFKTHAGTNFATLDPVRLYREKQALIEKGRSKPNDYFHREIAAAYARFELAEAFKKHSSEPTASHQVRIE
ncbi:MAG: hypothetical protein LV479_01975 [Methylacidiphilales bacterium]|nr:hypothetical protein [Candidatus Methylacidiphilales bacterium]